MIDGQEFAELHHRFRSKLGLRRQLIVDQWNELRTVRWSIAGVDMLHVWVHQLAGSSASFGYPALGEYARELEKRLVTVKGGAAHSMDAVAGIAASVERLRIQIDRVLAMGPSEMPAPLMVPAAGSSGRALICVVDSDPDVLELIASCLRTQGYRVTAYTNVDAMLPDLAGDPPAAILMDVGFSGGRSQVIHAIHSIRSNSPFRIDVVVISARTDIDARLLALRAGAAAFLTKPPDLRDLFATTQLVCIERVNTSLRVLVVVDDSIVGNNHAAVLQTAGMTASVLTQPMLALQVIAEFRPDVLLVDLRLPACSGNELVTILSDVPQHATLPVVCLSADASQIAENRAFELGARFFLKKPVTAHQLVDTLRKGVLESKRRSALLGRVTHLEAGRGADLREAFLARLDSAIQAPAAEGAPAALVYLALDQLAEVHGRHGVSGTTEIQNNLEKCVSAMVDEHDDWFVLGTTVIAIVLGARSMDSHRDFMAGLERGIEANGFWLGQEQLPCTASAVLLPLSTTSGSVSEVLARVEQAERSASAAGGNQYSVIEHAPAQEFGLQTTGRGLPVRHLALHLQPIVDEKGNEQRVYDVLVRLRGSSGALLPARKFLPLLESMGLAAQLDLWVMGAAVEHLMAMPKAGRGIELALRLSTTSLDSATFLLDVGAIVSPIPHGSGNRLIFQIDEEWLALHPVAGIEIVVALHDLGCGAMLCNFGVTQHPLSTTWAGWFDYAKVSQLRLEKIASDADERHAVEAMIGEAAVRGALIIACQIESDQTMSTLRSWGVRLFEARFDRL